MPRGKNNASTEVNELREMMKKELSVFKHELQREFVEELKEDLSASLVNVLREEIQELKQQILQQEKEIVFLKKSLEDHQSRVFSNNEDIMIEMNSRIQKKDYLIMSGVPEAKEGSLEERRAWDEDLIQDIARTLGCSSLPTEDITRIGKIDRLKPRLLRMKCCSRESRMTLLRKAKELRKSDKFRGIFLSPDLTHIQRRNNRALRAELKERRERGERVKIAHNKIVSSDESEPHSFFQ